MARQNRKGDSETEREGFGSQDTILLLDMTL